MLLYDYILSHYENGEPIFLSELPGQSKDYIRQEMKKLVDQGRLERLFNGVYYLPYTTVLGTRGKISVDRFIEKRYTRVNGVISGYVTGIQLANLYGFTTQNPACIEICSNEATTQQRKLNIDGRQLIVYKPLAEITDENCRALQFLDLMTSIDKYCELSESSFRKKLRAFVQNLNVDFDVVKKYITLFPDRVYRNIYQGGLMRELV